MMYSYCMYDYCWYVQDMLCLKRDSPKCPPSEAKGLAVIYSHVNQYVLVSSLGNRKRSSATFSTVFSDLAMSRKYIKLHT